MAPRSAAWVLVLGVLAAGCGKTDQPGQRPTTTTPTGGNGNGGGGSVSDGGAGSIEVPAMCATAPHPGPSPLTILKGVELNRSVLAQVPKATSSQGLRWLPEDFNDSQVSDVFVSNLHDLAHGVALLLTDPASRATAFNACDVASLGEETCRDQFLTQFLERAYRRPVTDDDRTEMNEVFAGGKMQGGDFASGMRAVIEVALQTPDFVYLVEQTSGEASGDAVALTSFETAARLAYFLTGGPPDDELYSAAKAGPLGLTELEAQARRLVGSAPNRTLVSKYYKRLFRLGEQGSVPDLGYDDDLATLATEETSRFIENVVFDGAGTFRALISEPSTWLNESLARLYGYPGVTGTAFQKVQLDPSRRAGMFTQSAFLRATSYSLSSTSPVHRGLPILIDLLCYQPPPPPPLVTPIPPEVPQDLSTRAKLAIFTQDPVCQDCHHDINPLGFAFEHYDVVGKWRDTDNGHPIDSTGELYRTDARGTFSGAPELLRHIAESDDAKGCFVHQWFGQAYRRDETPQDECAKAELSKSFIDSDGKIVELLVALGKSDNFRYRLKSELTP